MGKRRVYEPGRDRGWSNGKYWKPKQQEDASDEVYDAFCDSCQKIAPHQWDECIVCNVNELERDKRSSVRHDPDLNAFGRDLADH